MAAIFAMFPMMKRSSDTELRALAVIFVLCWLMAVVSYFGLIVSDNRLAAKAGVQFKPMPLWLLYLSTGMGPFISVWLDRRAAKAFAQPDNVS